MMTYYGVEATNASGWTEHLVTSTYGWQALYVMEALSRLAPTMMLSLRVSPMNGSTLVLAVQGDRWRFVGATSRRTAINASEKAKSA